MSSVAAAPVESPALEPMAEASPPEPAVVSPPPETSAPEQPSAEPSASIEESSAAPVRPGSDAAQPSAVAVCSGEAEQQAPPLTLVQADDIVQQPSQRPLLFAVMGAPGSGKTTAVSRLLQSEKDRIRGDDVPPRFVHIQLRKKVLQAKKLKTPLGLEIAQAEANAKSSVKSPSLDILKTLPVTLIVRILAQALALPAVASATAVLLENFAEGKQAQSILTQCGVEGMVFAKVFVVKTPRTIALRRLEEMGYASMAPRKIEEYSPLAPGAVNHRKLVILDGQLTPDFLADCMRDSIQSALPVSQQEENHAATRIQAQIRGRAARRSSQKCDIQQVVIPAASSGSEQPRSAAPLLRSLRSLHSQRAPAGNENPQFWDVERNAKTKTADWMWRGDSIRAVRSTGRLPNPAGRDLITTTISSLEGQPLTPPSVSVLFTQIGLLGTLLTTSTERKVLQLASSALTARDSPRCFFHLRKLVDVQAHCNLLIPEECSEGQLIPVVWEIPNSDPVAVTVMVYVPQGGVAGSVMSVYVQARTPMDAEYNEHAVLSDAFHTTDATPNNVLVQQLSVSRRSPLVTHSSSRWESNPPSRRPVSNLSRHMVDVGAMSGDSGVPGSDQDVTTMLKMLDNAQPTTVNLHLELDAQHSASCEDAEPNTDWERILTRAGASPVQTKASASDQEAFSVAVSAAIARDGTVDVAVL